MGTKITDVWLLNYQKMQVKNSVLEILEIRYFLRVHAPKHPKNLVPSKLVLSPQFYYPGNATGRFVLQNSWEINCLCVIESGSSLQQFYQCLIITHLCFIYFNNSFCVFE